MKNRNRFGALGHISYRDKMSYDRSVEEHIKFVDMLAMMVLHNKFGFGRERIGQYYREMYHLSRHYKRYNGDREPKFGRKEERSDIYMIAKDFRETFGIEYEEFSNGEWERAAEEEMQGL